MNELITLSKNNIKNNKIVKFNVKTDDIFNILEDILLNNGYRWRGMRSNTKINTSEYHKFISGGIININFKSYELKIISYHSCPFDNHNTIYLNNGNINILNYLFDICPTYKSKKIVRTL